ncbi:MAG TPA: hypothetical protein DEH24_16520 [Alteromonas sp.]|nr:hypothetical protein [Alteromonadaceae bacterium]HBY41032.1 hypothetical protein [Alteromonas sp.]
MHELTCFVHTLRFIIVFVICLNLAPSLSQVTLFYISITLMTVLTGQTTYLQRFNYIIGTKSLYFSAIYHVYLKIAYI